MRRLWAVLAFLSVYAAGCSLVQGEAALPQPLTNCGGNAPSTPGQSCVRVLPMLDPDSAPLNGTSLIIPFDRPVKMGTSREMAVVNAVFNLETRRPEVTIAGIRSMRVDPRSQRQLLLDVDALLADGAAIAFGRGVILSAKGKELPPFEVKLTTPWSPFAVALAGVVWDPTDRALFSFENTRAPTGATAEALVRQELEQRLRIRPGIAEEQVTSVLAMYDGDKAKKKVPDHRLRAGLLLLTGTSAEYAVEFILADSNRRGVPFEPVAVKDLEGAFAAVYYHPLEGKLKMFVDRQVAADSLEAIAVALAHEAVHSDLGGGSVTEELLAMACDTRVYQEFLLWDPTIARAPTDLIRSANQLTLAMRNSGRFGYPHAGVLPRAAVEDVLRGTGKEPARSFKDLLFKPHFYGNYSPKAGDAGTEVLEAYYKRISGNAADQGRLKYDQHTVKLFDSALDHGFTDAQILRIVDALKLKPVPIGTR
jgi:hypothetical protein